MTKKIVEGKEAYQVLLKGLKVLHDPVASTLGPGGRTVLIEHNNMSYITKDGATVARFIESLESDTNQGIRLLKTISNKMANTVGDGTTTATILTYNLLKNTIDYLDKNPDADLSIIEKRYNELKEEFSAYLKSIAKPCKDIVTVKKIAKVSTNNNEDMANKVAEAFQDLDEDVAIVLEENLTGTSDEIENLNGWQWGCGYMAPAFVNDPVNGRVVLENPLIYLTTDKLINPQALLPIIRLAAGMDVDGNKLKNREPKPLLIVARQVVHTALSTALDIHIHQRAGIPICVVEAPGDMDFMTTYMEDLRCVTGGKLFLPHETMSPRKTQYEQLGTADKVIVDWNKTTVLKNNVQSLPDVKERLEGITNLKKETTDQINMTRLRQREAKLKGKMVYFKVGSKVKAEVLEKKDRYEDAIYAVRASLRNGYIPGGGSVSRELGISQPARNKDPIEILMKEALLEPAKVLYENSHKKDYLINVGLINDKYRGYNLAKFNAELVDLEKEGIIEPVDILLSSLEMAVSLTVTGMRLGTLIFYDTDKDKS